MDRTVIIACSTIRPELETAMEQCGCEYPVIWMDAKLHDRPDKLNKAVQAELDALTDIDHVILPFGYCGGTTAGLKAGSFELILPKVDDCITMFLGSRDVRRSIPDEERTFFLTQGWLTSERSILCEYARLSKKYGQDSADMVMDAMYQHYSHLALIDTGLFPTQPQLELLAETAALLKLERRVFSGTPELLNRLLRGDWDDEAILRIAPHETVTKEHFGTAIQ